MRLTFDPVKEFDEGQEAIDELVDELREWLNEPAAKVGVELSDADLNDLCAHASLALDYKLGYGNGRLADWTPGDIDDYLLDWCPRKVALPTDDALGIPSGLVVLIQFLYSHDLLAGGASRRDRLIRKIEDAIAVFPNVMADPSRFGMAKGIFAALGVDSLEGLDEEDLAELIDQFNALPDEQRFAALGDPGALGLGDELDDGFANPVQLPPVVLPDPAAAIESARAAPMMVQLGRFIEFCGQGRKLTQKGHLTLADARSLVADLDTGDVIDPKIRDRVYKTRSSSELPGLQRLFTVAKKAGFVRAQHGKVLATKRGTSFGRDPLAEMQRAVEALVQQGPIAAGHGDRNYYLSALDEVVDQESVGLLGMLYVHQAPVTLAAVADQLTESILDALDFSNSPYWTDDHVANYAIGLTQRLARIFTWAGLVTTDPPDDGPRAKYRSTAELRDLAHRTTMELTPAGITVVRHYLESVGYDVPSFEPQLSDLSASELFERLEELAASDDIGRCLAESAGWRRKRQPDDAAAEVAAALATATPGQVPVGFQILRDLGLDVAIGHLEPFECSDSAQLRGTARLLRAEQEGLLSLVQLSAMAPHAHGAGPGGDVHGDERDAGSRLDRLSAVLCPSDHAAFLYVLADRLVTDGPLALFALIEQLCSVDEQLAFVSSVWRTDDTARATAVLETLAKLSPHKPVAKAARKAVMQHRSYVANLQQVAPN